MGNEFEYREEEKKPKKESKDLKNILNFYPRSLKKEENNIRFKYIKDNIFFSTLCDYDFEFKTLDYIDQIKTLFYLYNHKIYCFKFPELIRINEYEEIVNWYKYPMFISYQENTNRLYVTYYNWENFEKNEESFTFIYIFKDNKICMSHCINYQFDNLIDMSYDKLIILRGGICKCLKYVNNEYQIIKIFNKENFDFIKKCQKKDKFIAITGQKIIIIDINTFQYITIFKHDFCRNICILDNKFVVGLRKNSGVIEIYNLNNFKLLGQLNNKYLFSRDYIKFWDCGKSGYFIYNKQEHTADTFIAEFKNNTIKDVFCFDTDQIKSFSIFLYINDFLVVGEFGKIIIYKKEIEINKDI